jgi:CubicO group peptidase (beta-lactamase class C family)
MKKSIPKIIKNVGHVVDQWLTAKIKYDKIPGLSIGIVFKGELLYSKGFGHTDLTKKKKVDEKTLYHIASISKTFTTIAIMQLVDKDKLRLDDKVCMYIPWFIEKNKKMDSRNISIRQLLSHTAGLFRDGDTSHWVTGNFPTDLRKSFSAESLILENGTEFKYTNYGFSLLGIIIESVTGVSYDEYVKKNILKELGMKSTSPDFEKTLTNLATGHGREIPDEQREVFKHYKTNAYAPATGFISNVSDLAKYLGSLSFDSEDNLLSREAMKEVMRSSGKTENDREYGLGFEITYEGDKKIISHSGGFNGFITQILVDPVSGVGIVALSNTLNSSAPGITRGILKMIISESKNSNPTGKIPDFKKYEGLYRSVWGDSLVAQLGKRLLTFSPGANWPLKSATILESIKGKKDSFRMNSKGVFGNRDEVAFFDNFKSDQAQTFNSGSTPLKRVKLKK